MTSAAKWPVGIGVLVVLLIAAALIASNSARPRQALAECAVQASPCVYGLSSSVRENL